MSQFPWSQSIGAGLTFDPLETWNHQYPEANGVIKINHRANAVGLLATVMATDLQLLQEAPVPAGGTIGNTPNDFTTPPIVARVKAGQRLSIRYRNPTAGAIVVDGVIEYLKGGKV